MADRTATSPSASESAALQVAPANPDANLVVVWERSAVLRAPVAPEAGPLVPNGTGYLIGTGGAGGRLFPRLTAWARRSLLAIIPAVVVLPFMLVPLPYGWTGGIAIGAFAIWLPRALIGLAARRRMQRQLARAPLLTSWRLAQPGQPVRLEGTIVEQATVPSLFSGTPSVLSRSEYAGLSETRGIDFRVRLSSGELVHVPARDAFLVGQARRVREGLACGPVSVRRWQADGPRLVSALLGDADTISLPLLWREICLAPGDAVELCAAITREQDLDGEAGSGRGPALRVVARPCGGVPVLVRKRDQAGR